MLRLSIEKDCCAMAESLYQKAFTTKNNPNPDDFSCLEWEHERLYIYTKDQIKKLVLRRSEYTDRQKKKQSALDAKRVENGEVPRNLKTVRWTWHLTPHYAKYLKRIAELKIDQAILAKKSQKNLRSKINGRLKTGSCRMMPKKQAHRLRLKLDAWLS